MVNDKRIAAACQQCRQRKRRCDGATPCNHCIKHERHCVYKAPRRRGPGKSKAVHKSKLLTRQQRHISTSPEPEPEPESDMEVDEAGSHNGLNSSRKAQSSKINTSRCTAEDLPQRPRNYEEIVQVLPSTAEEFAAIDADVRTTKDQMQAQMDQSCFTRRVFTQLPLQHLTVDLLEPVAEEIQLHGVFLAKEDVLSRVDEQYNAGLDNCHSDPVRWAIVCAFLGISTMHRLANESLPTMLPMAWAFFKNAFATYTELAVREPAISSCEALLAMAFFMLRTANTRVAAQLIANAACVVHMLGLHEEESYVFLDAKTAERRKRVFWVVYIITADMTHILGLPSPLGGEEVVVNFPEDISHHDIDLEGPLANVTNLQQAGLLRHRAALAVMQFRIHKLLREVYFKQTSKRGDVVLLEAINKAYAELEEWKAALPMDVLSGFEAYGTPNLDMPVAMLQYIYLSCISKVSMAAAILKDILAMNSVESERSFPEQNETSPSSRMERTRCTMAARQTLNVLFRLHRQPFTHLWQTLCFPLSAVLILVSDVLASPASWQAETDAALILKFIQCLERLRKEGCDIQKAIEGCRRFWCIANCALIASRTGKQVKVFGQTLQSIHARFAQVMDWTHPAHSLLSNIPMPCGKMREVFAGIFEPVEPGDSYGEFVPEIFKSSNFLSFGA